MNEKTASDQKKGSSLKEINFFEASSRTIVTGVVVASALYPLDIYRTRQHAGIARAPFPLNPFLWTYFGLKPFIYGFINSNKASICRNVLLANRNDISSQITPLKEESNLKKQQNLFILTTVISTFDTGLTHYFSNMRILNNLNCAPALSFREKLSFAREAFLVRYTRNLFLALGCINGSEMVGDYIQPFIPLERYPITHTLCSSGLPAFAISPFTNAFDVVYSTKISTAINNDQFKTLSYRNVCRELWGARGFLAFTRGAGANTLYNTIAFLAFNGVSNAFDRYFSEADTSTARLNDQQPKKSTHPQTSIFSFFTSIRLKNNTDRVECIIPPGPS